MGNVRTMGLGLGLAAALVSLPLAATQPPPEPISGTSAECADFRVQLIPYLLDFDITDEGWVLAQRGNPGRPRYQSVSGVVAKSHIAYNDTPANHNSHDMDFSVLVDAQDSGVLSTANAPNTQDFDDTTKNDGEDDLTTPTRIGVEWEMGTFPNERGKTVPERYFPRWVWPSVGDRVWVNGSWVFDCGHAKKVGVNVVIPNAPSVFVGSEYYRSEIHPPRAVATMRRQADVLPGTGTTRVPVTATDLYVHGEAGFITDVLNCGMGIIIDGVDGNGNPDACATKTSPIAVDFEFDICLPPRPDPRAALRWRVAVGPANSVAGFDPIVTEVSAPSGCVNDDPGDAITENEGDEAYDLTTALHVRLPLGGSGIGDLERYTRQIVAGWIDPPATPLTHLRMSLDRVNVHSSGDGGVIASDDGELTFFYVNVDAAPNEWLRVADHAAVSSNGNSVLNDVDPSLFGDSFIDLQGGAFDFYLPPGRDVGIAARLYDQDCYDNHFGNHYFGIWMYAGCELDVHETGNNDSLAALDVRLLAPAFSTPPSPDGVMRCPGVTGAGSAECAVTPPLTPRVKFGNPPTIVLRPDYELTFGLEVVPTTNEDSADLALSTTCAHEGEVALPGAPVTCTITVTNHGPGLPRGVNFVTAVTVLTGGGAVAVGTPNTEVDGRAEPNACSTSGTTLSCALRTLAVGGTATTTVVVTPSAPGTVGVAGRVSTTSTDDQPANDEGVTSIAVYQPIQIDVQPGQDIGAISLVKAGAISVAIVTTAEFDASHVVFTSVCFGDDDHPAQRSCTEAHGRSHSVDVDKDKDQDMLLHFIAAGTGIDAGDVRACIRGLAASGIGIYGCDAILTTP